MSRDNTRYFPINRLHQDHLIINGSMEVLSIIPIGRNRMNRIVVPLVVVYNLITMKLIILLTLLITIVTVTTLTITMLSIVVVTVTLTMLTVTVTVLTVTLITLTVTVTVLKVNHT